MGTVKFLILGFVPIFLVVASSFSSEDPDFPKVAFVKNNGSVVKAGDNLNFENLCSLEKGDPVKVIGKRYSWFKIRLPKKAHIYVKNDFVDLDQEESVGIVNARRVNLRAGPGTRYSVLGQVSRPQALNVVSKKNGWYKIVPPEESFGWMHSSDLGFKFDL